MRHNWAGNLTFAADRVHRPRSADAVRRVIRDAATEGRRVHAVGSGHSFSAVADTDGDLVSTGELQRIVAIDPVSMTVTVGAGIRYGELGVALHATGLALHNLPSLPHISVGGAVATATHGSGTANRNLSAAVTALELVDASGALVHLSRTVDADRFAGAVVALGALGVVTTLTLAVEPTFEVAQDVYTDLPIDDGIEHLDALLAAGYSVSLFTDWRHGTFQQVWCKRRIDQGDRGAPAAGELLGAPAARRPLHIVDGLPPDACTEQLGVPGPWHERLPHFRLGFTPSVGDELQSEFFVDRADGAAALRAVRAVAPALAPLLVTEVRAVAADDLWLSPAFERDSLAIHVTWVRDEAAVTAALPALEAGLAPFDPRPHWGKLTTLPPEVIRSRFPRFDDFTALVDDLDPGGTFSNPYLERLRG